jgi:hypothetical protein
MGRLYTVGDVIHIVGRYTEESHCCSVEMRCGLVVPEVMAIRGPDIPNIERYTVCRSCLPLRWVRDPSEVGVPRILVLVASRSGARVSLDVVGDACVARYSVEAERWTSVKECYVRCDASCNRVYVKASGGRVYVKFRSQGTNTWYRMGWWRVPVHYAYRFWGGMLNEL